ncbi:beta-phosphoglucomutase [Ohtaekwangia koreensis]|uniref:Beta-phosphoglucomutase n=1 Tax=Ohtaekwangia koreensis TaxID=688867 RepID=A0A1T5KD85_9BACT|nr:beta-phosphoglucomutase [Ohtaekwangia koreensis]SKC61405.1 beta-phosphoglucomutase [Ohtaekwangia koreensis]
MIKAVIFDLDGVIVDTARYHFLAWKRLADELGIKFTEEDNERLKGVSRIRSMEILMELGGITLSQYEKEKLANKKNTWFVDYVERMIPEEIYSGVRVLIEKLKERGIHIALASSSKNARTVLHLLHIQNLFEVVTDGTMITHSKPDPEIFLLAAEKLGIDPKDCLVFEDAEAGIEGALAAGMLCVGIGSQEQLFKAHKVIRHTGDFTMEMLDEFNAVALKLNTER